MTDQNIEAVIADLTRTGTPFAVATIVRTVAATSAKAGAKAVISADGTLLAGWLGGSCATGAVTTAGRTAIAAQMPQFVSIRPEDLLSDLGVTPGETREGVRFARSMCPSHGSLDVFVEPHVPQPEMAVLGSGPVAKAVADLAPIYGFHLVSSPVSAPYCVVATQGRGDLAALSSVLREAKIYAAFVGSHRKWAALRESLLDDGADPAALDGVKAPAGLDIGAVTPEEIALSIIAEAVMVRRRGSRTGERAGAGVRVEAAAPALP